MNSDNPGFLLGDVTRLLRRSFRQKMAATGLSFEQARTLLHISRHEGIRQVDLADLLDVQPITLVHQIDQLTQNSLVERRPDPNDRRAYQLFLTPNAAPHLAAIEEVAGTIQADMFRGLGQQQIEQLFATLRTVRDNLAPRQ